MTPARTDLSRPFFERGVFTLSLDFELAWGKLDKSEWRNFQDICLREREAVGELLDIFHEFGVSASWCAVGHLFLNKCTGHGQKKHPEIRRAAGSAEEVRFSRDPGSNEKEAPAFYGSELIDLIRRCPTKQEIGSHSFSHVIFTSCGRATAEDEVDASLAAARQAGIEVTAFVFPRNRLAHLDVIAQRGFRIFRSPEPSWHEQAKRRGWLQRFGHLFDIVLSTQPAVVWPSWNVNGLWDLPGSMLYTPSFGIRKALPVRLRVARASKGLPRRA